MSGNGNGATAGFGDAEIELPGFGIAITADGVAFGPVEMAADRVHGKAAAVVARADDLLAVCAVGGGTLLLVLVLPEPHPRMQEHGEVARAAPGGVLGDAHVVVRLSNGLQRRIVQEERG